MTKSIFILVAIVLISSTILFGQKTKLKSIPTLSIYNLNGDTSNLEKLSEGKVTFIDFWFIPCGPCFQEMNMLHKLYSIYKNNKNFLFLTFTLTDSAFVRPLIENRNTDSNQVYKYFIVLAELDTFKLPVFFIQGVEMKMSSFRKTNLGFSGHGVPKNKVKNISTDSIFRFSGYPTILIFDKKGKEIYRKTGFTKSMEKLQLKTLEDIINKAL